MKNFDDLVWLIGQLRGQNGCSWDKKQTKENFKTFLLEEVYELIDAIDKNDYDALKEESGDLLFHIVFIAHICKEQAHFDIGDVVDSVYTKMYSRHPHVFMDKSLEKPIQQRWEEIKKKEKENYSMLSGIPETLPALLRAYLITRRVAKVGFDWKKTEDVYGKLSEELNELKAAEKAGDNEAIREELGDLFFTMVNLSRFFNVDPEDALRLSSNKFVRRFNYIEEKTDVHNSTPACMNTLWDNIKDIEKKGG